jgi:hypothetical protein
VGLVVVVVAVEIAVAVEIGIAVDEIEVGIGVAVGIEVGVTMVCGVAHEVVVVVEDGIEIEMGRSNSDSGSDAIVEDADWREYGAGVAVAVPDVVAAAEVEKRRRSYSGAILRCLTKAGGAVVERCFGILILVCAARRGHRHFLR